MPSALVERLVDLLFFFLPARFCFRCLVLVLVGILVNATVDNISRHCCIFVFLLILAFVLLVTSDDGLCHS